MNKKPVKFDPPSLDAARAKLTAHLGKHRPDKPFKAPIRVVTKWLFKTRDKKLHGHYKTTNPDAGNLNKLLIDVMEKLGFWKNDAHIGSETSEKFWTIEAPGIWIYIEELTQPEVQEL